MSEVAERSLEEGSVGKYLANHPVLDPTSSSIEIAVLSGLHRPHLSDDVTGGRPRFSDSHLRVLGQESDVPTA